MRIAASSVLRNILMKRMRWANWPSIFEQPQSGGVGIINGIALAGVEERCTPRRRDYSGNVGNDVFAAFQRSDDRSWDHAAAIEIPSQVRPYQNDGQRNQKPDVFVRRSRRHSIDQSTH